jgi:hypothetical protein
VREGSAGLDWTMNYYVKFFAGTYFYVLKVQNGGAMSERIPFAFSAILLMATSELLPLLGGSLFFHGLSNIKPVAFGTVAVLLAANYLLFVYRGRYIKVVKTFERQKQRLLRTAAAIHAVAVGSFFVTASVVILHKA